MRNVPSSVLAKYSHLFRIISNTGPFKGPFRCKNLIELSTVYGQEWSRDLLRTNPGLKRLVWGGPYYRRIETLEQQQEWELELKALMGLENLDVLNTSGFSLGEGLFVKMLRNNANRLSNLALSTVEGVTSIEGLELPYLTELNITFGGTESPALVDLVRCCPRLQRLSLTGSRAKSPAPSPIPGAGSHSQQQQQQQPGNLIHSIFQMESNNNGSGNKDFQIERLAQNIAECCPELSGIKFSSGHSYTSIIQNRQSFLLDFESAALVNACRRLESFSADMLTIDYALTEALVGHRESLRSLSMAFHDSQRQYHHHYDQEDPDQSQTTTAEADRIREIHCLRRLKASIVSLKELKLSWDNSLIAAVTVSGAVNENDHILTPLTSSSPSSSTRIPRLYPGLEDEVSAFIEEHWACLDLEVLSVNGILTDAGPVSEQSLRLARIGWKPTRLDDIAAAHNIATSSAITSIDSDIDTNHISSSSSNNNDSNNNNGDPMAALLHSIAPLTALRSLVLDLVPYERIPVQTEDTTANL
ncbi:hypothetical protein BGZ99_008319 [Dissophora globulifera]|uniref:Uncharacterized protein n=1 Tax=Dissophora globulifera TaxID=979702 RepID=A0A9P6RR92_9FUNG|nr:hypothetical protein BGZ99_008319 [Dissophora globulifera]